MTVVVTRPVNELTLEGILDGAVETKVMANCADLYCTFTIAVPVYNDDGQCTDYVRVFGMAFGKNVDKFRTLMHKDRVIVKGYLTNRTAKATQNKYVGYNFTWVRKVMEESLASEEMKANAYPNVGGKVDEQADVLPPPPEDIPFS